MTPLRPVYFRYLTILAYHIFLTLGVKCTILEVGIGGKYDSTNVVRRPVVTGITTLGLDHTALLGNTIEEIAVQKAGIYKQGCPAVSVWQQAEGARRIIAEEADRVKVCRGTWWPASLPAQMTRNGKRLTFSVSFARTPTGVTFQTASRDCTRLALSHNQARDTWRTSGVQRTARCRDGA